MPYNLERGGFLRPKISLKRLFIAISAFSVVFYLLCVRPTQVAENFVAAVKRGDFKELDSLSVGGEFFKDRLFLLIPKLPAIKDAEVNGGLSRQSWRGVIQCQRHCYVEFAYPRMDQVKPGEYQACVTVIVRAGITGVKERAWTYDERWK